MRKTVLTTCAALLLAGVAFPAWGAQDTFERTIPLAPGASFSLQNINGPVTITGWDRDVVAVRAVKSAGAAADLPQAQIDVATTAEGVSVTTTYPLGQDAGVAVAYSVQVPRGALLEHVATVNGAVQVTGVRGAGELQSVNGNIEVSESAGAFSAHTTNGNIRLALANMSAPRTVTAETVNGSILLALPADASALLDARNLNGKFHSDLPLLITGAYGSKEIHGRLGAGTAAAPVLLRTVNGAINVVALPKRI